MNSTASQPSYHTPSSTSPVTKPTHPHLSTYPTQSTFPTHTSTNVFNEESLRYTFPICPLSPALTAGSLEDETYTSSKEPYTPSNEPYTPSNEPYTPSNEPYTPSNEPYTPSRTHHHRQSLIDSLLDCIKLPPLYTRASTVSSRSSSPSRSPTRRPHTPQASRAPTRRHAPSRSLLENFFSPYASPGPDDYPAPEDFEMESSSTYTRSPTSNTRPRQASTSSFASTVGEKFGWLKSRAFATAPSKPTSPTTRQDETLDADPLINLDVSTSLFPSGPLNPLDPSSFHTLLSAATTLITTLQTACRSRTFALTDLRSELAAQTDELDEVETRVRHLKMQLGDMSTRMADTERNLRAQLVEERARREELEKEKESGIWAPPGAGSDSGFESEGESEGMGPVVDNRRGPEGREATVQKWEGTRPRMAVPGIGVVPDLRTENVLLRQRVVELEGAVDACLQLL